MGTNGTRLFPGRRCIYIVKIFMYSSQVPNNTVLFNWQLWSIQDT